MSETVTECRSITGLIQIPLGRKHKLGLRKYKPQYYFSMNFIMTDYYFFFSIVA